MARRPQPRYRADRDLWYCQIGGKRHELARGKANRKEADSEFHRLMVRLGTPGAAPPERLTVAELFNRFLAFVDLQVERDELDAVTYEGYGRHLSSAADEFGAIRCADLKPRHVQDWVDRQDHPRSVPAKGGARETRTGPWGPTTRNNAIGAVKRAFAWGEEQGHIDHNPVARMKKPRARKREVIPKPEEAARLFAGIKGALRDLILALYETGCRPGEAFGLTAADCDLKAGTWTVRNKTRRKTGEPTRTVYLSEAAAGITRRLCEANPEGPIFLNSRGNPWNRNSVGWRLNRLRKSLGLGPEVVAYALRHLFATDMRAKGVPDAWIASMMGHRDTKMIATRYGVHIDERSEVFREALRRRGEKGEGSGGAAEQG